MFSFCRSFSFSEFSPSHPRVSAWEDEDSEGPLMAPPLQLCMDARGDLALRLSGGLE